MKRIALTACLAVVLQSLTGCCSCCDVGRAAPCYSNCLPADIGYADEGCCGDGLDYGLPPSPYGPPMRRAPRPRSLNRQLPTYGGGYTTTPYMQDWDVQGGDGTMYENFGGEVIQGDMMPQSSPSDSGWQPKAASPIPSPSPMPDTGPTTFSAPSPIPAISSNPMNVPGPPTIPVGVPRTSTNVTGPDMGPMPPAIPDNVSQMGYRRKMPIQRAF